MATLFPGADSEQNNRFDDGTTDPHEWWLRDGSRVVAVNGKGAYATWWITADGLFRRDPYGAAYLRYLPPKLEATVWQQTSGDATVEFRLQPADRCGDYPQFPGTEAKGACWQVGAGLVGASLLDPAHPAESYHKLAAQVETPKVPPAAPAPGQPDSTGVITPIK